MLPAFCEWAESALTGGGRILVHCQSGVSRSCSLVIGYLMWKQGLGYDEALAKVKVTPRMCPTSVATHGPCKTQRGADGSCQHR